MRVDRTTVICKDCNYVRGGPEDLRSVASDHKVALNHTVEVRVFWVTDEGSEQRQVYVLDRDGVRRQGPIHPSQTGWLRLPKHWDVSNCWDCERTRAIFTCEMCFGKTCGDCAEDHAAECLVAPNKDTEDAPWGAVRVWFGPKVVRSLFLKALDRKER